MVKKIKEHKFSKLETIIICLCLVMISGIFTNLGGLTLLIFDFSYLGDFQLLIIAFFILLGFIVVPFLMVRNIYDYKISNLKINIKKMYVYIFLIIFIGLLFKISIVDIIHPLIISFSEEFLFRSLIMYILLKNFKSFHTYIIGSFIFAFILHINGDFLGNLIIKFPISILLYFLADKYGLQETIAIHWIYNMLVTKLY